MFFHPVFCDCEERTANMIIATKKECIQAARQYVRRLGREQRSLAVMARQMKDLQRELDRMDGLGSSGNMRGGGHARGAGGSPVESIFEKKERVRRQLVAIERKRDDLQFRLMLYEQALAGLDEREAQAVQLIDFKRMTQLDASMEMYVTESWARALEHRGLVHLAMMLLGMMDEKTAKDLHWNEMDELLQRHGADREQPGKASCDDSSIGE